MRTEGSQRTEGSAGLEAGIEAKGWTQAEAAAPLETTQQTVSDWCAGNSTPRLKSLARIKELFGVEPGAWLVPLRVEVKRGRKSASARTVGAPSGRHPVASRPRRATGTEG